VRTSSGYRLCLIAFVATLLPGCRGGDETASAQARRAKQEEAASLSAIEIYSRDGVSIRRLPEGDDGHVILTLLDGTFQAHDRLFPIAASLAPERIEDEAALPEGTFLVSVKPPERKMSEDELRQRAWKRVSTAYEKAFHVRIHHVSRVKPVFVLHVSDHGLRDIETAKESDSWGWGTSAHGFEFRKHSFEQLADFLTERLSVFVFDETGDKAVHKFEVPVNVFDDRNPDVWIAGLKKVGLELRKADRKIAFTAIEKSPAETPPTADRKNVP
jgi:uncharacterized protein (TIGR03435 family)